MRIGWLYADGDEYAQDFDVEENESMSHVVCEHYMGICLDEITEPAEHIARVIWSDGIESDDLHEVAAIQFWNGGY